MSEEIKKEDTMPEDTPLNEEKSSGTDTAMAVRRIRKRNRIIKRIKPGVAR